MEITIREALTGDYEALCEIYGELDGLHRQNHPEIFTKPEEAARAKEYLSGVMEEPGRALFAALADGKLAGFAECCIQSASGFPVFKKREWVQLDSLAVKKKYQNLHIGSLLLDKVTEWAGEKNIPRIELKVYSFNSDTVRFYENKGFRELSRTMFLDL